MKRPGFLHRIFSNCRNYHQQRFIRRISQKLQLDESQQSSLNLLVDKYQPGRGDIEHTLNNSRHMVFNLLLNLNP